MNCDTSRDNSPLSIEDIQKIDSTKLSKFERHHLRVIAHCLAVFKSMDGNPSEFGALPSPAVRLQWCLNQPDLAESNDFINVLLEQFELAAIQLNKIAEDCGISPLELTLNDLILDANERGIDK